MKHPKLEPPVRIVLLYILFGSLWILFSDQILLLIFQGTRGSIFQTIKGLFFILISGLMLYALLHRDLAGRKQAEKALLRNQAQLTGIFDSAMDAILAIDTEQRIVMFNPAAEAMFRCSQADAVGQPLERFIPPRFRSSHSDKVQSFTRTGVTSRSMSHLGALYALRNDGEEFPVEASISKTEAAGSPLLTVILRDITERKRAEAGLQLANARFQRMVDANVVGIVIADADGRVVMANDYYLNLLHVTRQELLEGKVDWRKFTPPEWLPADEKAIRELREQGICKLYEKEYLRFDGSRVSVYIADAMLPSPEEQIIAFVLDITDRKQAEAKLKRHINYLTGLREVDQAITSSFDVRLSLNILASRAVPLLKVDAASILLLDPVMNALDYGAGHGFWTKISSTASVRLNESYAGRAVLQRRMVRIPNLLYEPQNLFGFGFLREEKFVTYFAVPLIVKGKVVGVMEVFTRAPVDPDQEWFDFLDSLAGQAAIAIDNARLWEQVQRHARDLELRVAERTGALNHTNAELEHANRAKDEFLANMSHELRTPLNSILGLTESLLEQRRDPLTADQQNSLENISSSGHHLLELINDVLDLSKIEAGKLDHYPQIVNIDMLCRSSLSFVNSLAAKKSITVTYHNPVSEANVFADPRRLKQILVNLLTNAVKFTPEGGQVTLAAQIDAEQDLVEFSVTDSGIGIAPQDLRHLFQPFVQVDSRLNRQFEGTGLGLALVHKLTDMHGGSVDVESQVGSGSRFTITIPWGQKLIDQQMASESAQELLGEGPEGSSPPPERTADKGTVLLAEDNQSNILTIGDYLESHGYRIVKAYDGLDAIEKAQAHRPDIILMDIQMPVMDGLEAMRKLRADTLFAATPIIVTTALAMPGDRERCLEAGANEYMTKPVRLKVLKQTIEKFLDRS